MKKIFGVVLISLVAVVLTLVMLADPVCASGTCNFTEKIELKDSDTVVVITSTGKICGVQIKAATELFTFYEDGSTSCYSVEGIGAGNGVTVSELFERDCVVKCHDMSHIKWGYTPTAVTLTSVKATPLMPIEVLGAILFLTLILVLLIIAFN